MKVRFWGVRGTIPVPGPDTVKIGGNTSCVDLFTSDQQIIILDAGTGIRQLGRTLVKEHPHRITGTILFSHTHWDHIQGFPFFAPAFERHNRFVVVGQRKINQTLRGVLQGQFIEPYLPFQYDQMSADFLEKEITVDGERIVVGDDTSVEARHLDHPGGCLGYRINNRGTIVAYCTDTYHPDNDLVENVITLAQDADLLIHDAHFSPAKKQLYAHYGHCSWMDAARAAKAANVKTLALFHHDPDASDAELYENLEEVREVFPRSILAREGLEMTLPLLGDDLPD